MGGQRLGEEIRSSKFPPNIVHLLSYLLLSCTSSGVSSEPYKVNFQSSKALLFRKDETVDMTIMTQQWRTCPILTEQTINKIN